MSTLTARWRQRRRVSRNQRAIADAVAGTSSPSMRDELLVIANRGDQIFR